MFELIEPKEEEFTTLTGDKRAYVLSKFPAVAGREIVAGYPITSVPKIGDYKANEEIMLKLMCYVGAQVGPNKTVIPLATRALVDQHFPDYETLVRVEIAMMKYNTSFFREGVVSDFLSDTARKVLASISPTLTDLLGQSLVQVKQRLENLKRSTP